MKKFSINTVSNVATRLWSMLSIYIFIPLYIKMLGETAYGLVSFFATLQTALNIMGLGLSNTLRREFAVGGDDKENASRKYKLLRSVENIYFVLAFLIIAICICGADFIAKQWLNIEMLDPKLVSTVISLMGVSIALQLVANLYVGCLFGLDYQLLANSYCVIWSIAKSCGTLAIIAISPNLILFYLWHIFDDLCYLLILRKSVVKKLDINKNPKWRWKDFSNVWSIWRYAAGILFISFIALINKQLDKAVISKCFTLTELGAYNLATTLGGLTTIIPSAIYTTVFPRFTNSVTTGNRDMIQEQFLRINKFVNWILSCMGAFIAVYALPLIQVWTGKDSYTHILEHVGSLVVLAVAITEYQEIPYALALANGNTKINVFVGAIFIPIVGISTFLGVRYYGLVGAATVHCTMMCLQTLLYEVLVYRQYVKKNAIIVIFRDTVLPLLLSLFLALSSRKVVKNLGWHALGESIYAVISGSISLVIIVLIFGKKDVQALLHRKK